LRRELERLDVPGEHEARERAWSLVQGAYAEREPQPRGPSFLRPVLVAAALAAIVAAALSAPGRAVLESVREVIGVEGAEPSLLALPADGRVIVHSTTGPWIVASNGTRRMLGPYDQASWSPRGLYIVATRGRELVALTPRGDVRWRRAATGLVDLPRWAPSGFRIAYHSGGGLRVVAGDGTADRLVSASVDHIGTAWRPGTAHVLAYADRGAIVVADVDSGRRLWRRQAAAPPHLLLWSPDGTRLLVLAERTILVFRRDGTLLARDAPNWAPQTAAFAPRGHAFAVVAGLPGRSEVRIGGRVVFSGTGAFNGVDWSPDGRWLLVGWGSADQWVFVRTAGEPSIRAVANVSEQFQTAVFPSVGGWCCS
jgi:outer membrane protein assembly factor BamB